VSEYEPGDGAAVRRAPGMYRTAEQRVAQLAELTVINQLQELQDRLKLTDLAMFSAVSRWGSMKLKYMLAAELEGLELWK